MGLGKFSELQQIPKHYWVSDEGWQFCLYMAVAFPELADHWNNMAIYKIENSEKRNVKEKHDNRGRSLA